MRLYHFLIKVDTFQIKFNITQIKLDTRLSILENFDIKLSSLANQNELCTH